MIFSLTLCVQIDNFEVFQNNKNVVIGQKYEEKVINQLYSLLNC